jgi:hypothetical protein
LQTAEQLSKSYAKTKNTCRINSARPFQLGFARAASTDTSSQINDSQFEPREILSNSERSLQHAFGIRGVPGGPGSGWRAADNSPEITAIHKAVGRTELRQRPRKKALRAQ